MATALGAPLSNDSTPLAEKCKLFPTSREPGQGGGRKPAVMKRIVKRFNNVPSHIIYAVSLEVQLKRMSIGWPCPNFVKYLLKEKIEQRTVNVPGDRLSGKGCEKIEIPWTCMYAGLDSLTMQGAPPDQNTAEGFISALKATTRKCKHHINALAYLQRTAVTLKNW